MAGNVGKKGSGKSASKRVGKKSVAQVKPEKRVEEQTRIALEKYRILFESFPLGISITDAAGNLIETNKESERLLGLTRTGHLQRKYDGPEWQIIRPDGTPMPPEEYASVRALKENRRIENVEMGVVKSDNEITWINVTAEPIPLESFGVAITYGDISAHKQAEDALARQKQFVQSLIDTAQTIILVLDISGRIVTFNSYMEQVSGYKLEEIKGKDWFSTFLPQDKQTKTRDLFLRALSDIQTKGNIDEIVTKDGQTRTIEWYDKTLKDTTGNIVGLLSTGQDITDRKRAEEALQESEKRVKTKLDAILSPQGDIGKLELEDILDIQAIQAIMDDFYKLTNVSAWILDINGKHLVSTGWRDICTQFHRANAETCKNCVESDTQLSEGVAPGTFKIYKCKNNMWDLVTPLIVGGNHVGNLFLGQFLFDDETLDYELFRSQAHRFGFNEAEYLAALERVPRLSKGTVNTAMGFYSKFAHMISTLSHSNIQLARSLTEKNSLLDALQTSEAQYRLLSEHITDTVWLMDMNFNITYHSPSVEKIRGFTAQEIMEMPLEQHITPESLELAADIFVKELPRVEADPDYNPVMTLDLEYTCKNGSTVWTESNFSFIRDSIGKPVSILGEARDITERKLADEALRQSEAKYRTVLEQIEEAYYEVDLGGNLTFFNDTTCHQLGYSTEDLMGMNYRVYTSKDDIQRVYEIYNQVYRTGKPIMGFPVCRIRKDGARIFTENSALPLLNNNGKIIGFRGVARDITRRLQAEDAMRESEAQYRLLAEHTTDFVWLMDLNLTPTYQSPSAERLTGFTHEELMTLPIEKRIAPESLKSAADMFFNELPRIVEDPQYNPVGTLELEILRKDGSTLWSENKFSVIRDEKGRAVAILGEARDITKRRDTEKKLEQTLAALEKTLSDTVIAISKMVEMKDPFTAGHQIRVAQLAVALAKKMNMTEEQVTHINTAATIHDIGKIYVPSDILSKPGKLGALEYQIIQTHVQGSYDILKAIDFSGPIAQIVYQHHERMDGSGYPRGLKGADILPEAKILIVADVVEAMSSHRPYRAAMGIDKALEEITNNRSIKYDEACIDACLGLFREDQFEFISV